MKLYPTSPSLWVEKCLFHLMILQINFYLDLVEGSNSWKFLTCWVWFARLCEALTRWPGVGQEPWSSHITGAFVMSWGGSWEAAIHITGLCWNIFCRIAVEDLLPLPRDLFHQFRNHQHGLWLLVLYVVSPCWSHGVKSSESWYKKSASSVLGSLYQHKIK